MDQVEILPVVVTQLPFEGMSCIIITERNLRKEWAFEFFVICTFVLFSIVND